MMKSNFCKFVVYQRVTSVKLHSATDELLELFRSFSEQLFLNDCFFQGNAYYKVSGLFVPVT